MNSSIERTSGPCIIKAGAGTGKTYTSVQKIKHLVEGGFYAPKEILCLTFSNEATNEFQERLAKEIKHSSEITIKNFHGFCADILKEHGGLIKIPPDFQILPPDDAKVLFHKELDITPYWANRYVATISTARDFGISLEDIKNFFEEFKKDASKNIDEQVEKAEFELNTLHLNPTDTKEERREIREKKKQLKELISFYQELTRYKDFIEAWDKYVKIKKEKKYLDYSDLNNKVLELFRSFGSENVAQKYKYVFVDEFQDTNKLQFELIEFLARAHKNITIVGDLNQSIYGFRGSYKEIFEHFKKIFEVTEEDIFNLNRSYRSPNTVLRVSHQLIQNNYENPDDCFFVDNAKQIEGNKVECYRLKNSDEEARKIAELVEEEIKKGTPASEICIVHRTHAQSKVIEQALMFKGISYIGAGYRDLLSQKEIKTVISYLAILHNLRERTGTGEQAWWNLFHYHNSLSPADSIKIGRFLKKKRDENVSIDEAIILGLPSLDLSEKGKKIIKRVIDKLSELMKNGSKPLPQLVLDIYDLVGLNRQFSYSRTTKNVEAMMNLREFYKLAENYYLLHSKSLTQFIKYLEILDDLGVNVPASEVKDVEAVRLMTIHATKGLQFDTVIVSNMAQDRFPLTRTRNEPLIPKELLPDRKKIIDNLPEGADVEKVVKEYERESLLVEERRLCYVAFTRAKKRLIMTFAASYNSEENSAVPSIFLKEINFDENEDINFVEDLEEASVLLSPNSTKEQFKSQLKEQIITALDSESFEDIFSRMIEYYAIREGEVDDFSKMIPKIDTKSLKESVEAYKEEKSGMKFNNSKIVFSPTALLDYHDCPKRYELSKLLQMPRVKDFEWTGASAGSFIHKVLEDGVNNVFTSKKQFYDLASKMANEKEWEGVDLDEVNKMIDVFWERNNNMYDEKSLVEEKLPLELNGYKFFGIADRIDIDKEGVVIIDYKSNKSSLAVKHRNWQLGYYILAARAKGMNVKKVVLEMLKLEKPLVMTIEGDEVKGPDNRTKGFNIKEVEKELLDCADSIVKDFEGKFDWVEDDAPCKWCGLKFYCPKWENK
jgi:DNA helicase II / ATP-dependent DNA helicase PcrA